MNTSNPYIPLSWETVNCPFCESSDFTVYERFGSSMQYTYALCKQCSLVYQSPRPKYDQDFINAAYASYYQYTDSANLNEETNVAESSVELFKKEVNNLLKFDTERTIVLDIGSGMGTFLYVAKQHYQNAMGLDVSEKMAKFVEKKLGVKIFLEQFDSFSPGVKFSLIHMSHVIEHIPNPDEWIKKARTLLSDNGVLVINVPNKFSINFRMQYFFYKLGLKKQFSSSWNDPSRTPDHLFEPNVKSMKYILEKNDFEILDYFSYSRKDPASDSSLFSKIMNRWLKLGSNLTFITRPNK